MKLNVTNPKCVSYRVLTPKNGILPNQELSVLYGGPTPNYGRQLSLYFPHMLRVNMPKIWHTCNYLIYREKLDLYAELLIYRVKESLYAERNGYYPYCNNVKKIVLRASMCIFSSYFLFVDASLTIFAQIFLKYLSTWA